METECVRVGIQSGREVAFSLHGHYEAVGKETIGLQHAVCEEGKVCWNGQHYESLHFVPVSEGAFFELYGVTIGRQFHWQRDENQLFAGSLLLIVEDGGLTVVNILPVEDYLTSVISSEMSAHASLQLLKAHAVISRSWLISQKRKKCEKSCMPSVSSWKVTEEERIGWYGHDDHLHFDVCADDHCQRYQGITRASTPAVRRAVQETAGEVLLYGDVICDARFSKCCGGMLEKFSTCWEDVDYPYLQGKRDWHVQDGIPDLRQELAARAWVESRPDAFCNTADKSILRQVLNSYDQETTDFYRWQVVYTQKELSALVCNRLDMDLGQVLELVPLRRGVSGRISLLRIVGEARTLVVGKELEIRRVLSPTHLYSSAFVVNKIADGFVLSGGGWGHGVGLCQIGAAVMGHCGYRYDEILLHYYPDAHIGTVY